MLSHDEYLQKLIDSFKLINNNKLVYLINREFRVIYMSELMLGILNKRLEDVLGKHFLDVAPVPSGNAKALKKSLQQILKDQQSRKFLSINSLRRGDENRVMICIQTPYINNDQVVAIGLQGKHIDIPLDIYSILINSQLKQSSTKGHPVEINLTPREQGIAFLLLHCRNSLEIAQVLTVAERNPISEKTVRNVIARQLFKKFQVSDQKQLISKLRALKYHKKIPDNLFRDMHIDLQTL